MSDFRSENTQVIVFPRFDVFAPQKTAHFSSENRDQASTARRRKTFDTRRGIMAAAITTRHPR